MFHRLFLHMLILLLMHIYITIILHNSQLLFKKKCDKIVNISDAVCNHTLDNNSVQCQRQNTF